MKRLGKPATILVAIAVGAVVVLALAGWYLLAVRSEPPRKTSLEQRQKEFVRSVDAVQLQNKNLVFESSGPLCVGSGQTDCTLSKTFVYKLDGNYRDNGKEIFAYLKSKGFDFKKGDKYKDKTEKKLKDTTLADNLSDSEPIIVDIYNTQNNIRVRVSLGDRGRTLPYAKGQVLSQLPVQQLIAGLQFYNP